MKEDPVTAFLTALPAGWTSYRAAVVLIRQCSSNRGDATVILVSMMKSREICRTYENLNESSFCVDLEYDFVCSVTWLAEG